jgi:tellurite methyltransferase
MVTYDKHYRKLNYFGNPYEYLMDFFDNQPKRGLLCDLGAGQGRDSIPLSKMGYSVTAVDISKIGLLQIKNQDPSIEIIEHDINTFDISNFDFVLLDSMVHFYKNDLVKEVGLISKILNELKRGTIFVNCMIKSKKAESILKNILDSSDIELLVVDEGYMDYPDFNAKFHFIAIKRL